MSFKVKQTGFALVYRGALCCAPMVRIPWNAWKAEEGCGCGFYHMSFRETHGELFNRMCFRQGLLERWRRHGGTTEQLH